MRKPGAEALPGGPFQVHPDGVFGQAGMAVTLGDLAGQHGAGGAVDISDWKLELDRLLFLDRGAALRNQRLVEHLVERVVLALGVVDRDLRRHVGLMEDAGEIETLGLPMVDGLLLIEDLGPADHLGEGAEAECGHIFADLFGDEEEEIDDVLGLAGEARAQHRVLRGDADRAGVQMAFPHHDAAGSDQRRGGEAEFVGAEQRTDDDVAPGAQAAIDLHGDAAA